MRWDNAFGSGSSTCVNLHCRRERSQQSSIPGPIRFSYRPIDFRLDSDETPPYHAPETMAGGVAVFDYNNDGKADIFFANGANSIVLLNDSPRYYNRLFENRWERHSKM